MTRDGRVQRGAGEIPLGAAASRCWRRPRRRRTMTLLGFACALAHQCFINEYVYATIGDEEARAAQLRDRLDAALAAGAAVPPLWVAAVAAYFPLHELAGADALLARSWPAPIAALLDAADPRAARGGRAARRPSRSSRRSRTTSRARCRRSTRRTPIRAGSGPRSRGDTPSVDAYLRETFPSAPFRASAKSGSLDILIAGCGTGQHAIMTARQYEGARVLAIDLSRASLAYAAARTRALGLDSIEYAQADIMRLGALGRSVRPDRVERRAASYGRSLCGMARAAVAAASGRLHAHRLYSEIARWGVVAARAFIAEQRLWLDARRDPALPARPDAARRRRWRATSCWFNDFYSMSECRDLVFHTQEHRMTLARDQGVSRRSRTCSFLGFEVDRATARRYAARFPADTAMTDLDLLARVRAGQSAHVREHVSVLGAEGGLAACLRSPD